MSARTVALNARQSLRGVGWLAAVVDDARGHVLDGGGLFEDALALGLSVLARCRRGLLGDVLHGRCSFAVPDLTGCGRRPAWGLFAPIS